MTPQEAIDFIDNEVQIDVRYCSIQQIDKTIEVFTFAKEALEKQIPKKHVKTKSEIVCPTCRTLVGSNPYCKYCGQALDWSDTE